MLPNPSLEIVKIEGKTVENVFQAAKATTPSGIRYIAKAKKPGYAKRLGRKTELRKDWEQIKIHVMYLCLVSKFRDRHLRHQLVHTKDALLIEGNTHDDKFWGMQIDPARNHMEGENHLGRLLMIVRKQIKQGLI